MCTFWNSIALYCVVHCWLSSCTQLPPTLLCGNKTILNPVTIRQYQNNALSLGVAGRFMLLTFGICFCLADSEKAQDCHCVPVTLSLPAPGCWNVLTGPKYSPVPFSRKVMHSVWATILMCGLEASLTRVCIEIFHRRHWFVECWWCGHFFFFIMPTDECTHRGWFTSLSRSSVSY